MFMIQKECAVTTKGKITDEEKQKKQNQKQNFDFYQTKLGRKNKYIFI